MTHDETEPTRTHLDGSNHCFLARIAESPGEPPECTIYPAAVSDRFERMTHWITAVGDSFVGCREMR